MAKVHVLSGGPGGYNCVAHALVPVGSNTAGLTWKAVVVGAGLTGPGTAGDAAEKAQIVAGDVLEVPFVMAVDAKKVTAGKLTTELEAIATRVIAARFAELSAQYAYWGYSQGTVT